MFNQGRFSEEFYDRAIELSLDPNYVEARDDLAFFCLGITDLLLHSFFFIEKRIYI